MALQDVLNQVKGRVQAAGEQAQALAKSALEANKKAYEVVSEGVQALAKAETQAAKDLLAQAKDSFNKAKTAGVKAVVQKPADFLPSKDRAVAAFNEGKVLVLKTRDELVAAVKGDAKPVAKKAAAKKAPAKKAVATASKAA